MIPELFTAFFGMASEALKLINQQEATKYVDRIRDLKLAIDQEEARGYDSDDTKIMALWKEMAVETDALRSLMALHATQH